MDLSKLNNILGFKGLIGMQYCSNDTIVFSNVKVMKRL